LSLADAGVHLGAIIVVLASKLIHEELICSCRLLAQLSQKKDVWQSAALVLEALLELIIATRE
jgi:hypothetical protein